MNWYRIDPLRPLDWCRDVQNSPFFDIPAPFSRAVRPVLWRMPVYVHPRTPDWGCRWGHGLVSGRGRRNHSAICWYPHTGTFSQFRECQLVWRRRKAILARDFVSQHLGIAKEILLDIHEIDMNGDTVAVNYIDGIDLGQELLYQYLATENISDTPLWCK